MVDASGLDYQCHSMSTVLEGDYDQVMEILKRCFEAMSADCDRIACTVKLDYRRGHRGWLQSKVARVEGKLGHDVRK